MRKVIVGLTTWLRCQVRDEDVGKKGIGHKRKKVKEMRKARER